MLADDEGPEIGRAALVKPDQQSLPVAAVLDDVEEHELSDQVPRAEDDRRQNRGDYCTDDRITHSEPSSFRGKAYCHPRSKHGRRDDEHVQRFVLRKRCDCGRCDVQRSKGEPEQYAPHPDRSQAEYVTRKP